MSHVLHFSLGPAQDSIAEARRTRDWWAGSFVLSWLAGQAMRAVEEGFPFGSAGYGQVTTPTLEGDPMWVAMHDPSSAWPIGTLPNRFRAVLDDPEGWVGHKASESAVRHAWETLAEAVWTHFLANGSPMDWNSVGGQAQQDRAREIWNRQIRGFWEISWVLGETPDAANETIDASWLDRRKNWRSHPRPDEPGDHCRMMGDRQELSGLIRARQRDDQDRFWHAVRRSVWQRVYPELPSRGVDDPDRAEGALLELGASERLCAIAMVKRLFPLLPQPVLQEIIGWSPYGPARGVEPGADRVGAVRYWPSTSYIAAVPWMIRAFEKAPDACLGFAAIAERKVYVRAVSGRDRRVDSTRGRSRVPRLAGAHGQATRSANEADFGALDGTLLFESTLEMEVARAQRDHDRAGESERPQTRQRLDARETMRAALGRLLEEVALGDDGGLRARKFRSPAPYFALVAMDGDRTGKLITEWGGDRVSKALQGFTEQVTGPAAFDPPSTGGIVGTHDGVLIYAGGDDVQALLPLTTALAAVRDLHSAYLEAFRREFGSELNNAREPPTISAGLVIAHFQQPLGAVVREAHRLLDSEAKGANGRNSLALARLQPSGSRLDLVTAFGRRRAADPIEPSPVDELDRLAAAYAQEDDRTTAFLYRVRRRYGSLLEGLERGQKKENRAVFQGRDREDLLLAEWLKGRASDGAQREKARKAVRELIAAGSVRKPLKETGGAFTLSGGLLARFLADNGLHATSASHSTGGGYHETGSEP